jgi:hypothetical protein
MKIFKKTLIAATLLLSITSANADIVRTLDNEIFYGNVNDAIETLVVLDDNNKMKYVLNSGGWDLTMSDIAATNAKFSTVATINRQSPYNSNDRQMLGIVQSIEASLNALLSVSGTHSSSSLLGGSKIYAPIFTTYGSGNTKYNFSLRTDGATAVSSGKGGGWSPYTTAPSGWFYISRSSDRSTAPGIDEFATQYAIDNPENVSAPALLGLMSLGLFGFAARRRNAK